MDSRNVLTVLIVIFVAVLLYNALYFTGMIGGFGGDTTVAPLEQDPRFTVPGQELRQAPGPRPSGGQQFAANGTSSQQPRAVITAAELGTGPDWGRNPFLTPRELWALANYRPIYLTDPAQPPTGLFLSAVVMDSSGRRVAIINGDIVAVGQQYAGMQVVDMSNDAVMFELEGRRHVVRMADAAIGLDARSTAAGRY
jgi:hypothetical protein